ncbi:MAG: Phosphoesterase MutT/NUDIX family [Verrucomicrobiales bacterium]|nr:Phosphoesterase MutT/NUDIX family [Verrucomicrobiales bacterium]
MGMEENVLVVPEADLKGLLETKFVPERAETIRALANQGRKFLSRAIAETDETHKQIIPYIAICHGDKLLVLKRSSKQSEARLHNKLSLGIGGHINDGEVGATDLVQAGMLRELSEEIELKGGYTTNLVGVIYDPSTAVGRVHLGIVFRIDCERPEFTLGEPDLMTGEWVTRKDLQALVPSMETWSQLLVNGLFS